MFCQFEEYVRRSDWESFYDRRAAWQKGRMTEGLLRDKMVVWQNGCMTGELRDRRIAWQKTCVTEGLRDRRLAWRKCCVTIKPEASETYLHEDILHLRHVHACISSLPSHYEDTLIISSRCLCIVRFPARLFLTPHRIWLVCWMKNGIIWLYSTWLVWACMRWEEQESQ